MRNEPNARPNPRAPGPEQPALPCQKGKKTKRSQNRPRPPQALARSRLAPPLPPTTHRSAFIVHRSSLPLPGPRDDPAGRLPFRPPGRPADHPGPARGRRRADQLRVRRRRSAHQGRPPDARRGRRPGRGREHYASARPPPSPWAGHALEGPGLVTLPSTSALRMTQKTR